MILFSKTSRQHRNDAEAFWRTNINKCKKNHPIWKMQIVWRYISYARLRLLIIFKVSCKENCSHFLLYFQANCLLVSKSVLDFYFLYFANHLDGFLIDKLYKTCTGGPPCHSLTHKIFNLSTNQNCAIFGEASDW